LRHRNCNKQQFARSSRTIARDTSAGRFFGLPATRLGLGAFSTAALNDALIERDLGINGVSESVIYVTGCGMPAA